MQLEGKTGLFILEACDAAHVSRAGFYRHFDEHLPRQADTELRQQIQQICLDNRCYGSRRVIVELQKVGLRVNRKRVMRLMRADNLLCLRKRRFVCTTDSRHTYAVYPNLTRDWKPSGINQLWVADITYIPVAGVVYLSGSHSGRLFAARDRLGTWQHAGSRTRSGSSA